MKEFEALLPLAIAPEEFPVVAREIFVSTLSLTVRREEVETSYFHSGSSSLDPSAIEVGWFPVEGVKRGNPSISDAASIDSHLRLGLFIHGTMELPPAVR